MGGGGDVGNPSSKNEHLKLKLGSLVLNLKDFFYLF